MRNYVELIKLVTEFPFSLKILCKNEILYYFVAAYSNIRSALKMFFDKFELSLQRLSLRLEQAMNILQVFENFMFIYSINLSGNKYLSWFGRNP